ncbi:hypothetical protein BpHYR1_012594 [Brachionus plicatilis]|uniref:Uncharacterized protein n=1 Tax=Brachionus plicatilis TaxID=10195 RepID=A0A3M7T216_BRAPC|nr:hypothetical protein BpHYR1_012594 [Brachionus plicatilis]
MIIYLYYIIVEWIVSRSDWWGRLLHGGSVIHLIIWLKWSSKWISSHPGSVRRSTVHHRVTHLRLSPRRWHGSCMSRHHRVLLFGHALTTGFHLARWISITPLMPLFLPLISRLSANEAKLDSKSFEIILASDLFSVVLLLGFKTGAAGLIGCKTSPNASNES